MLRVYWYSFYILSSYFLNSGYFLYFTTMSTSFQCWEDKICSERLIWQSFL